MQLTDIIVALSALATFTIAGPVVPAQEDVALVARQNCQNHIDRCDQNGCAGAYSSNQFIGVCTQGQWAGCPCNRCGNNIGSCNDNGCQGNGGRCTAGLFVGCQCR